MITKKQRQVFDFVKEYHVKHDYSPSLDDIKRKFKLASVSTAHYYIKKLKEAGQLNKERNQPRSVVLRGRETMVKIPFLGIIAAGEPIEVIENRETIAIPKSRLPRSGEVYALRVQGDSMIDEGVNDGDTILINKQNVAENGDKVVALLNGNEATLKTFYKEKGQIRLQPANKNYKPIIIKSGQQLTLQGVLLDVIETNEVERPEKSFALPSQENIVSRDVVFEKENPYFEDSGFILYHGDCLKILSQLPDNSIDMIFADPPYNLSNNGFSLHAGKRVSVNKGTWDKSRGFKDDYDFHYKWLEACKRVLKPEGSLWVSGTYHSIYQCGHALQSLGYHILNDVAWFKPNASPNLSCRFFTASHETLIWARKEKKAKHTFNYELMKNGDWTEDQLKKPGLQMRSVWAMGTPKNIEKKFGKHPTQKPENLLKRIVLASTNKGSLILDPFTGSSTTGVAAHLLGRRFIGIDTESKYLDISIKRFEELEHNLKRKYLNTLKS